VQRGNRTNWRAAEMRWRTIAFALAILGLAIAAFVPPALAG